MPMCGVRVNIIILGISLDRTIIVEVVLKGLLKKVANLKIVKLTA
jgi:hypothetical protein